MAIPDWVIREIQYASRTNSIHLDLNGKYKEPLTEFPDSILDLGKLQILDLSHNQLTRIPEYIWQLKNLTELDLRHNNIKNVPASILNLRKLRGLYLSNNQIARLPEPFSNFNELIALYIDNNLLATLPQSIIDLKQLVVVSLHNNPLASPPPEITLKGLSAIKEYFRQLEEAGQFNLYEAKILILGEGGAGKTTLAKKIENPDYQLQVELSTEGVEVLRWPFITTEGREFKANVWDFGGQEIYHSTHQFFLTKRSLYLLVVDTRKEDTDYYYWLNIVELLSDNSPLIIIKNEINDRPREINIRQLRGQYENLKDVLSTNFATNRGLDKIREEIKYYLTRLPHIGSPLPKTWIQVREVLEKDPRNYISLNEYYEICEKIGIGDKTNSLQLSDYLHSVGVILHFQGEPLLRKTIILKPKWGTNAVYKILDNKEVIQNLGRFSHENIKSIWSTPEYADMQSELLNLMLLFRLCYEIPNQKGVFIAPQLLTEDQPEMEWDGTKNLLMRFTYEFMPKGILSQFIVAMHDFILEQTYVWKSGVILEKSNARAEVIELYNKREIRVRVSGTNKKDLIVIIDHELNKIHASYKKLKYDKLIPCNCSNCQSSQAPYFYPYERLQKFFLDKQERIQCPFSYKMVNVRGLIDDVTDMDKYKIEKEINMPTGINMPQRNKLFISYSHRDKDWLLRVQTHLKVLENLGISISWWDDTKIKPGMRWREEIADALSSAKVALVLISTDFLASDFIAKDELPPLLKAAEEDGATILPLILKPSLFTSHPKLKLYQSANDPSKPLSGLSDSEQDLILVSLSQRIVELMSGNSH